MEEFIENDVYIQIDAKKFLLFEEGFFLLSEWIESVVNVGLNNLEPQLKNETEILSKRQIGRAHV